MDKKEFSFTLRFKRQVDDDDQIPVSVITKSLSAFQRIIHLLAMEKENLPIQKKARVNQDIESKYTLMCSAPQKGSLSIETTIGNTESGLFDYENTKDIAGKCKSIFTAVNANDIDSLNSMLPDRLYRGRVLESLRAMSPPKGSSINLDISNGTGAVLLSNSSIDKTLESISITNIGEEGIRTITGTLSKINFNARELTITYPVNNKELKCYYRDDLEGVLLENPREFIQVKGMVILDDEGYPKQINEVELITEMNLSPFLINQIKLNDNRILSPRGNPLEITPFLDESKQLICLEKQELGIDVYSYTRDELASELDAQIDFLWTTYAEGDTDKMTPLAKQLADSLRRSFQVVP